MSFAALVDDALACLAAEHPEAHARMFDSLAGRRIEARVDAEDVEIAANGEPTMSRVRVRTDVETLCAILMGERDVVDEILADRLDLVGSPGDLVAVGDALMWFVEGAMRCVSITGLVDRLITLRGERHGG